MMRGAVIWDLDGTLVESEAAHGVAFDAAVAELGLVLPDGFHEGLLGNSGDTIHGRLREATGLALDFPEWRALKWRHYQAAAERLHLRAPTVAAMRALRAEGVPMAVASNSTADEVAWNLRVAGLDADLPVRASRDDVARGKPAPDLYLLAAERLGVAPAHCVVVEDSRTGAQAGVAAGMTVILQPEPGVPTRPVPGARLLDPDAPLLPALRAALTQG